MGRVLLAAIVGAILEFGWGFVSHAVLQLQEKAWQKLPNESAAMAELKNTPPGMYAYPWLDMKNATDADRTAWVERAKAGGHGFLVQGKPEDASLDPGARRLVFEFLSNLIGALILVVVGAGRGFGGRVMLGILAGVFAWASQDVSYWIWHGFSDAYTTAGLVDAVAGWTIASIGIAIILRPRPA